MCTYLYYIIIIYTTGVKYVNGTKAQSHFSDFDIDDKSAI